VSKDTRVATLIETKQDEVAIDVTEPVDVTEVDKLEISVTDAAETIVVFSRPLAVRIVFRFSSVKALAMVPARALEVVFTLTSKLTEPARRDDTPASTMFERVTSVLTTEPAAACATASLNVSCFAVSKSALEYGNLTCTVCSEVHSI